TPRLLFWAPLEGLVESYDPARAKALFARFARNGTAQVPTLSVLASMAFLEDRVHQADPRLELLPPAMVKSWRSGRPLQRTPEEYARDRLALSQGPRGDPRNGASGRADPCGYRHPKLLRLSGIGAPRRAGAARAGWPVADAGAPRGDAGGGGLFGQARQSRI